MELSIAERIPRLSKKNSLIIDDIKFWVKKDKSIFMAYEVTTMALITVAQNREKLESLLTERISIVKEFLDGRYG